MRFVTRLPLLVALPLMAAAAPNYPAAPRGDQVDDYFGTKVADPYRWMEDIDSAPTQAWIKAERVFTAAVLAPMPERAAVRARLTELWNYARFGLPFKRGGHYFFTKNDGLQNQAVLYVQDTLTSAPRALLDPNALSTDGTMALTETSPSPDGQWLGYGLASAGSDWNEFHVRSLATGQDTADVIKWVKFSGLSWTKDAKGFFYGRYPEPAAGAGAGKVFSKLVDRRLYYHRLGTAQAADKLVFALSEHPEWNFSGRVTDDGRYLEISVHQNGRTQNALYYLDLRDPQTPAIDGAVVKLLDAFDANYAVVGNRGATFFLHTNKDAPRGKIVAIDLATPATGAWQTLVAESPDSIDRVDFIGGRFVVTYMHDAQSRVAVFGAGASRGESALPGIGAVEAVRGRDDEPEVFFSFASYLSAPTIFRHDLDTGKSEVFQAAKVAFDAARFMTEQVFFPSKDGTKIPMFLTHRRDMKRDGTSAALLYGYGGFNIAHKPEFAVPTLVWLEQGGVYADVCLRGGSEYGEAWHLAGTKEHKQNVFDDYIAAADWLVAQGYAKRERLAIYGRSNGGLLVGAVLNQRPDLCGVALPTVGVMDMLRYHKFTVGAGWASDYGNSDDAAGFKYLAAYSPLHTVKPGAKYPPVLITTGDHDDRVFPAHSFKYAAAMQAAVAGRADAGPVVIRIDTNAGHGGASGTLPIAKSIDEWADRLGFALHYVGVAKN